MSLPGASAVAVVVASATTTTQGTASLPLLASTTVIGVVGGLLAGLRPRYVGGWLLLAVGIAFLAGQWCELTAAAMIAEDGPGAASTALWVANWLYAPALVLLFVLVPLTFPDGRLPGRRWRPVAVLAVAVAVAGALVEAFAEPALPLGPRGATPTPIPCPG